MIKDNLKLMDIDESLRESYTKTLAPLIAAAKTLGLTLDAATSDVVLFVEDNKNNSICIG